jgi:hypothetical protein
MGSLSAKNASKKFSRLGTFKYTALDTKAVNANGFLRSPSAFNEYCDRVPKVSIDLYIAVGAPNSILQGQKKTSEEGAVLEDPDQGPLKGILFYISMVASCWVFLHSCMVKHYYAVFPCIFMNNNTREAKAIRIVAMTALLKVTWLRPWLTVLYYRTYEARFSSYLTGY